jgi:hypothetical protein
MHCEKVTHVVHRTRERERERERISRVVYQSLFWKKQDVDEIH